jgi:sRNA-binding carbon storage regulator CsrA
MLVLGRKTGEKIILLQNGKVMAKVMIVRQKSDNKFAIGIEADSNIKILREELLESCPDS